ncbi:hypothetical protein LJB91_00650 [Bacteroidales bacterium OttesenSCG-928-L03]|nr:hypothetical protein [Bacteroidales bacterium OttesenSCG-928-L03]
MKRRDYREIEAPPGEQILNFKIVKVPRDFWIRWIGSGRLSRSRIKENRSYLRIETDKGVWLKDISEI